MQSRRTFDAALFSRLQVVLHHSLLLDLTNPQRPRPGDQYKPGAWGRSPEALEGRHGAGGAPVPGPGLEELVVQDQTPGECGMPPGFRGRRGW